MRSVGWEKCGKRSVGGRSEGVGRSVGCEKGKGEKTHKAMVTRQL